MGYRRNARPGVVTGGKAGGVTLLFVQARCRPYRAKKVAAPAEGEAATWSGGLRETQAKAFFAARAPARAKNPVKSMRIEDGSGALTIVRVAVLGKSPTELKVSTPW